MRFVIRSRSSSNGALLNSLRRALGTKIRAPPTSRRSPNSSRGVRGIACTQPNPRLNGRSIPLNMRKVLGGGPSINVMAWARGHKNDWDFFASRVDDPAWNYDSILQLYKRIEDWHGAPDPQRRGTGGPAFVQSAPDPKPIAPAVVEGARSIGIPTFEGNNGRMMESNGGIRGGTEGVPLRQIVRTFRIRGWRLGV